MKATIRLISIACVLLVLAASAFGCTNQTTQNPVATTAAPMATAVQTPVPATPAPQPVELVVFAAASMTETLNEIATLYKKAAPNVTLTFNFDSSGTLQTQIEEGADCDIFISAAQKQMNALDKSKDATANPKGSDFVLAGTRVNILENKVVLVVPKDNPANIKSFADIVSCKSIALGNDDVPVGQYSTEILTNLKLLDGLKSGNKITYGSNVKEVTTQVSEGTVDCGIVYATDAFSAKLTVVDQATKDMCKQVIYPAAVLNISEHQEEAKAFIKYLQGTEAMAVFEKVGFKAAS